MTAATLGTSTEAVLYGIKNKNMVIGLQDVAFDLKFGYVTVPTSTSQGSEITVKLWDEFGIKRLLGIKGFAHTTENSVIVAEAPTVTVGNGVLVITVASSNDDAKRFYILIGV